MAAKAAALGELARAGRTGPWQVQVVEGSMRPALEPGDWLLVDPTIAVWPKRGTIVVVRSPDSDLLTIKRVAARPGDVIRTFDGPIRLGPTQAWLLGDERPSRRRLAGLRPGRARPARGARLVPLRPRRRIGRL